MTTDSIKLFNMKHQTTKFNSKVFLEQLEYRGTL